jgi:hypothetical protein
MKIPRSLEGSGDRGNQGHAIGREWARMRRMARFEPVVKGPRPGCAGSARPPQPVQASSGRQGPTAGRDPRRPHGRDSVGVTPGRFPAYRIPFVSPGYPHPYPQSPTRQNRRYWRRPQRVPGTDTRPTSPGHPFGIFGTCSPTVAIGSTDIGIFVSIHASGQETSQASCFFSSLTGYTEWYAKV